jgi:hypothetical protein
MNKWVNLYVNVKGEVKQGGAFFESKEDAQSNADNHIGPSDGPHFYHSSIDVKLHVRSHDLKIAPAYFAEVSSGEKTFEVRKNDRGFRLGDVLVLREYEDKGYTGSVVYRKVGYILPGGQHGIDPEYVVLGLKEL